MMARATEGPVRSGYVAITGPSGAGKTALARVLHDALAWELYPEGRVESENQYFWDAYRDFGRWGFHSQVDFLTASAERHRWLRSRLSEAGSGSDVVVEDRTPFEHSDVYVPAFASLGRIEQREVGLLSRLTRFLEPGYVVPDLLVARELDKRTLRERVERRARPGERLDLDLIAALKEAFDRFLSRWDRSPVLVLGPETDVLEAAQAEGVVLAIVQALDQARQSRP
jgi:hypothetical protein